MIRALLPVFLSATLLAQKPGPQADGSFLLPTGWLIKPAGTLIGVDTMPMAARLTPDRRYLLVLNAGFNPPSISVIDIAAAKEISRTPVPDAWLGMTLNKAGDRVYVGGGAKAAVYEFSFASGKLATGRTLAVPPLAGENFIGDVQFDPEYHLLYAAELFRDSVAVINPQSGVIVQRFRSARRPWRILFHPNGKSFFVSSWTDGSVLQYETARGAQLSVTRVAPHTTDMVWQSGGVEGQPDIQARIFVAAANTNNVYSLAVKSSGDLARLETINVAPSPRQPAGMTPSGLGLSMDGEKLFVACSDANAVAVVDITGPLSTVTSYLRTGWYPTAVLALPEGRIGVLNGKGAQSGSVQLADLPEDGASALTEYHDEQLDSADRIAPAVKHIVYIIKGNRTFDQTMGEASVSPSLRRLAGEYVTFNNFYVNGETIADGMNWATSAIATDYSQRLWPATASRRRTVYDFEGSQAANVPPAGYIWTNAVLGGLTIRNYGLFAEPLRQPTADGTHVQSVKDPVLAKETDMEYRPFDLAYSDVDRAKEFLGELEDMDQGNQMPNLILMRLDTDRAPAGAADNDKAIAMVVDGLAKSKFWNEIAVFIVPSDVQDGNRSIEGHRAPAWLISPHAKKQFVDDTMYTQASVLRTIELILGLKPMTVYDAAAAPMKTAFR